MIKKKKYAVVDEEMDDNTPNVPALLLQGETIGLISGMVGAGGGFIIIPAVVLFSKLDMRMADYNTQEVKQYLEGLANYILYESVLIDK